MHIRPALARGVLLSTVSFAAFPALVPTAFAAQGDCAQPLSGGAAPIASDCLYVLRAAVGAATCSPACICAPKGTLPATATDALICLKIATGQSLAMSCPCAAPTTTMANTTTTTLFTARDCGSFDSSFGEGRLLEPYGVALDADGNVYVADSGLQKIVKFDAAGAYLKSWGGKGSTSGKFIDPRGIAVGPNGHVYVTDTGNYRVQVFDSNGAFLSAFGSMCFLGQGAGCVDPDGAGPLELGDGQFIEPYGIAVDATGDVYVSDASNGRIEVFDAGGTFERKWTTGGVPRTLAVGGDTVFVGPGDESIVRYASNGTFVGSFGSFCRLHPDGAGCVDPDGAGPLELGDGQWFILGMAAFSHASLFVVDDGNRRIQWVSESGSFRAKWGTECCFFDGIGCVDPDGAGPLEIGDGQLCSPTGIAVDASGRVLVADHNARVQRFGCPDLN